MSNPSPGDQEIKPLEVGQEAELLKVCNRALYSAADDGQILRSICKGFVEVLDYPLVWGGTPRADSPNIVPDHFAGRLNTLYKKIRIAQEVKFTNIEGNGSDGTDFIADALLGGEPTFIDDLMLEPLDSDWREDAVRQGVRSCLAIPLTLEKLDMPLGVLCLYSDKPGAFDGTRRKLFKEIAALVGFGLLFFREASGDVGELGPGRPGGTIENFFHGVFQESEDGLVVQNPAGKILHANRALCRMYGYSEDEMRELDFRLLLHPDSRSLIIRYLKNSARGQRFYAIGIGLHKNESPLHLEIYGAPVKHKGEARILGTIRNISERVRMQKELRASEARYRSLVNLSPDGILVHRSGVVIFANPTMAQILYADSADSLLGLNVMEVVAPEFRAQVAERIKKVESGVYREIPRLREKLLRMDGSLVEADIKGTQIDFQGERAVLVIVRPLTPIVEA